MKKFLSNPAVALILTLVLVIGSTLLNTRIGFGKKCAAACGTFYQQQGESASLADSLRALCNASENLALLATSNSLNGAEAAMTEIRNIRAALENESCNAGSIYSEYEALLKETFQLETELSRLSLSDTDTELLTSATHAAAEAKAAIDASSYNPYVRIFLKRYGHFPTGILSSLAGVSMPQLFA